MSPDSTDTATPDAAQTRVASIRCPRDPRLRHIAAQLQSEIILLSHIPAFAQLGLYTGQDMDGIRPSSIQSALRLQRYDMFNKTEIARQ
jgi:hypothetical protein